MRLLPIILASVVLALVARGQDAEVIATPTPAPLATVSAPPLFQSGLAKAKSASEMKAAQTLAKRAASLTIDKVEASDVDVLAAFFQFASQDERYNRINRLSYYGAKLSEVRRQIAVDGLTPEHKATVLSIYQEATAALQAFLAAEAASSP